MKIALVANSTWNIYNFRLNVIDRLIAEGHDVVVIAPIDEYVEYKEKYPNVVHINLRTLDRDSTNPLKDLLLIAELMRKYRKVKPDLILHYTNKPNIFGGFAAKLVGVLRCQYNLLSSISQWSNDPRRRGDLYLYR